MTTLIRISACIVFMAGVAAGQTQQCQRWVDDAKDWKQCFPFNAWVLDYHCDSGQGDKCRLRDKHRQGSVRAFQSKQDAIDWIHLNYHYAPGSLFHRGEYLSCWFTYLYPDSTDSDTALMKDVDCDTEENLNKRYSPDVITSWGAITGQ